ncbi:MAG: type II toxin-antitoxin system PemK/MazF family toxin [Micromonosporaceae bacterium]
MSGVAPAKHASSSAADVRELSLTYAPDLDGAADPGEVVWTWVPYEENDGRGKDRPLVVIARRDATLYGLMLSSNPRRAEEPGWLTLGTGAWDAEQRVSYVRLDRLLEFPEDGIRREGAVLHEDRYQTIVDALHADR